MKQKEIWIVDDDRSYQLHASLTLEDAENLSNVRFFDDGKEALERISFNSETHGTLPDLIFLDVLMPKMDGWEFLEEFSKIKDKLNKKVVIYLCSTLVEEDTRTKALKYPEVQDYITKPVDAWNFETVIKKAGLEESV